MKSVLHLFLCFLTIGVEAQDSVKVKHLHISAYAELYYSYDLSKPADHQRPDFFYNYKRTNEVNLNLGYLKASYNDEWVRGNLALMVGTYPQYNLASEQGLIRNVFEAHAGIKMSKTQALWFDAGVMPSHIGFESAVGKDCWTLSRSMAAENSPYYETGAKIGYINKNEKWYLAAMYLNGWQHIQRPSGNQTPAFGTQISYKPKANWVLNWSTFVGNDKPDSLSEWRYFNNLYAHLQVNKYFGLVAGFDIGYQQSAKGSSAYNSWYTPIVIIKCDINSKFRVAARGEYFSDEKGVIVYTGTQNGFQTLGTSLNLDYLPVQNMLLRLEAKALKSKDAIFTLNQQPSDMNYCFTAAMAFSF